MLEVLYEDNHIIVVEKPVNIPSQQDKTEDEDMLTEIKNTADYYYSAYESSYGYTKEEFLSNYGFRPDVPKNIISTEEMVEYICQYK